MYLYHNNNNSILKNHNIQIFCEECYLDTFLSYFGYFNIEFTYIDCILMAVITQDETYLNLWDWNSYYSNSILSENSYHYENRLLDYGSFFFYFLSLYNENYSDFLIYILQYSSNFFEIPVRKKVLHSTFLDYDINTSNLSNQDKIYFLNKIKKQLHRNYIISGLQNILNNDVTLLISEY